MITPNLTMKHNQTFVEESENTGQKIGKHSNGFYLTAIIVAPASHFPKSVYLAHP